jgi:protein phosphatase
VATDTGRVRGNNQDSFLVVGDRSLFAVADGMGGHQGGEVASKMAVDALEAAFAESSLDSLIHAVEAANTAVFERGGADPQLRGMGTTMVAVALVDDGGEERLAIVNVGDSRVYLFEGGDLTQITEDHSLVAEMVRDGRLSPEDAETHPQRNIVTRVLGIYEAVDVDRDEVLPFAGQRFLLCSDGLFNEVTPDQIAAVLRRLADPDEAARELVRLANEGGGRDNITVIVVDVIDDEGRSEQASAALAGDTRAEAHEPDPAAFSSVVPEDAIENVFRPPKRDTDEAPAPRARRFTWRVVLFLLVLLAVIGGAFATIGWYAQGTYYVGFEDDEVAIYQGRPGGVLWIDPSLEELTGIPRDKVKSEYRDAIEAGREFPTRGEAERYVANVQVTTTTTSTTTTTVPPVSTTTAVPPPGPATSTP